MRTVFAQRFIDAVWRRHSVPGILGGLVLTPASWGFAAIVGGRNWLYDKHWLTAQQSPLKIISVGNLTVGGTGKTPVVLWLAQALTSRGHKVGILSRGYKGARAEATVVGTDGQPQATPDEVGDEAVMLARLFPGVVIAGRDRAAGARLAQEQFGIEVLILDDGFQHRRLRRDIDLLLFNAQQSWRQRQLLPAGPFREPLSAARRADIFLVTKSPSHTNRLPPPPEWRAVSQQKPVYFGNLRPVALVSSARPHWRELSLTVLSGKRVATLTGIADPAPFYHSVREWDAEIAEVMEFPDHHQYSQTDWQRISTRGRKVDLIVTTEKDLVKLERFPFATGKLVALRARMVIEQEKLLLADIEQRLTRTA